MVKPGKHANGNAAPANQNKAAASSGHVQKKPVVNVYFPEIDFLTVEEFQQVPKYVFTALLYAASFFLSFYPCQVKFVYCRKWSLWDGAYL